MVVILPEKPFPYASPVPSLILLAIVMALGPWCHHLYKGRLGQVISLDTVVGPGLLWFGSG
jgi:hypothetical protein